MRASSSRKIGTQLQENQCPTTRDTCQKPRHTSKSVKIQEVILIKRQYVQGSRLTHLILGCRYDDADGQDDSLEHSGIARDEEHHRRPCEPSSPYALDFVCECEEEVRDQKRWVKRQRMSKKVGDVALRGSKRHHYLPEEAMMQ